MVNREVVLNRLDHLKRNLEYLKGLRNYKKEEFSNDPDIYLRYERALHLAVEAVIDLGNHIIADQGLRTPESNRDVFKILAEHNYLEKDISESLMKMAGFRNILVHDYLDLNRELEYEIMKNNIQDIEIFMKIVAGLV